MQTRYILWILCVCTGSYFLHGQPMLKHAETLSIGESLTFHSDILEEDRILNIHLPPGYAAETAYPVIYLLDGSRNEDFLHITGLVQFFQLQFGMPEVIIIGIANVDRKRDFTFPTDLEDLKRDIPTSGHSDAFIQCLERELIPFVENRYKTADSRYLIGQSLGGLLATEILLTKPVLFTHYLLVSPSLWWDDESLLDRASVYLAGHTKMPEYVFIAVGKKEHPVMRKDAKKLYKILASAHVQPGKTDLLIMQKEDHASILHNSIYEAFLRLFPLPDEN